MATLEEALAGLNYTGADTGYGIAAQTLNQVTPQLINPYGSTGQAVGIGLGSILLQSLLGYQARQQASRDTLELNSLANQLMTKATPEARTEFIGGVSDPMYQGRLSTLSTALTQQDVNRKIKQAERLADLTTAAEFETSPLAEQVAELKATREANARKKLIQALVPSAQAETDTTIPAGIVDAQAKRDALIARGMGMGMTAGQAVDYAEKSLEKPKGTKDWFQTIPAEQKAAIAGAGGSIEAIKDLANQFRELKATGVGLAAKKLIPGSPEDLAMSKFETLVPGMAKMIGQLGNLNIYEQQALKEALEGRGYSGSQSIASRLDQLANLAEKKIKETTETYKLAAEGGGEAVLQRMMGGAAQQIPNKANADIAKLQAVLANPKISETTKAAARAKIQELSGQ